MFIDTATRHAPIKKSRVKGIETPWMTSDLSSALQDRDYHHRKAVKTSSSHHGKFIYKKLKIYINKAVVKCKAEYYQDLINKNKLNSRELWKTLNKVTSRKSSPPPSSIETNGISLMDPKDCRNLQHPLLCDRNQTNCCDTSGSMPTPLRVTI